MKIFSLQGGTFFTHFPLTDYNTTCHMYVIPMKTSGHYTLLHSTTHTAHTTHAMDITHTTNTKRFPLKGCRTSWLHFCSRILCICLSSFRSTGPRSWRRPVIGIRYTRKSRSQSQRHSVLWT